MKVDLSKYQRVQGDDPNDPYQKLRCVACREDDHKRCAWIEWGPIDDGLDGPPVNLCTCQCNDDDLTLMCHPHGEDCYVKITTERVWANQLDSTRMTFSIAVPNIYLIQAIAGRNSHGIFMEAPEGHFDQTPMKIEDLALDLGAKVQEEIKRRITLMIREKAPGDDNDSD